MIIVMENSELNQRGVEALKQANKDTTVQYYNSLTTQTTSDEELILLDLSADGEFQELCSPEQLASELEEKSLLNNVKVIHLLISDVSSDSHLIPFAKELAIALEKMDKKEIHITVPTDMSYQMTLLAPPETNEGNWKIYGLSAKKSDSFFQESKDKDYESLEKLSNKKLLWQGKNIVDWQSSHPDRMITAKPPKLCL